MDDTVREAEFLFGAAFNALPQAIVILDAEHNVRCLNRAAQQLLDWDTEQAQQRPWRDVLRLSSRKPQSIDAADNAGPTPGEHVANLLQRDAASQPQGAKLHAEVTPIDGPLGGTIIALSNQPSVRELERALEDGRRQLSITYDSGQVNFWEWDLRTDIFTEAGYWVDKTRHSLGSPQVPGIEIRTNTHPDDVGKLDDALAAHLRGDTRFFELEQRVRAVAGGYIHFLVRGQAAERNADGRVVRIVGTSVDVSEMKKQDAVLSFALESSQQGLWELDVANDRITEHAAWRPQLDHYILPKDSHSQIRLEYVHPDDRAMFRASFRDHIRGRTSSIECEVRLHRRDGSWGEFLVRGRACGACHRHVHRNFRAQDAAAELTAGARERAPGPVGVATRVEFCALLARVVLDAWLSRGLAHFDGKPYGTAGASRGSSPRQTKCFGSTPKQRRQRRSRASLAASRRPLSEYSLARSGCLP